KFTRGGKITIEVARTGESGYDSVQVKVQDAGPGIDPEVMRRIFSKFVSKSEKGTGLGLFISKSIIDAHNGRMIAENCPEGGVRFTFTVPAKSELVRQADANQ